MKGEFIEMKSAKEVGQTIKHIRIGKKLSQKDFSKKIETTVSALSNWENGRNYPKDDYLINISNIFNVPLDIFKYSTKERVTEIVNSLEKRVNENDNYKILYSPKVKNEIIEKATLITDKQQENHNGLLNFSTKQDILDTLNNLIIDENLTIGYNFEYDNEVFSFIDTELRNFTSKNIKLLISKNAKHDLIAKIENELYNAIDNIDKLK